MKIYTYGGKCNISGVRIREAREKAELSQAQLAARLQVEGLNVTQKAVSRVETGARVLPDFELSAYARALGVEILWLLNENQHM